MRTAKGCVKNKSRLNGEKESTGIWDQIQRTSNKFGHPAHDDEQQQEAAALLLQQQQQYNSSTQSSSSSSSGNTTLYEHKIDFSIVQTTPQSSS